MDERGMENEHLEQKNSPNTEYLPTKCRITKPPPPKPAKNPLQFIKVGTPPLFQKAKEQISQVEKIKKERKEVKDEAEDWQANLDNWKSSRRKLQEHIIERVVEVKKLEQEENGRTRRKSKTFNEILEERGKSKYSIPIYIDNTDDWSDYGISESKSDLSQGGKSNRENGETGADRYPGNETSLKTGVALSTDYTSEPAKKEIEITNNNNHFNNISSKSQLDSKDSLSSSPKNNQYTYEGAIEGYRSRIKSRIDDSLLIRISDMPKRSSEVETLVPKGQIVKRKELFDKPQSESHNVPNRVFQDFENSISIKQRLQRLEKCNDQTVKYVDNINIKPKVKQISQLFDKPCTDSIKNSYNDEITQNNKIDYPQPQRREKININIVPWRERENTSDTSEVDIYLKEVESQSDDNKSSDTFYSGLEDHNYPPSVSSTDYMALSSDREDSGIHTADASCSVSQADDTAEELESTTNSHETGNEDFPLIQKYYKDPEDGNVFGNHILELTEENIINQAHSDNLSSQFNSSTTSCFSKDDTFDTTLKFLENAKTEEEQQKTDSTAFITSHSPISDDLRDVINDVPERVDVVQPKLDECSLKFPPFTSDLNDHKFLFDTDFPLLPTKMVEPPKVKPPPPPVLEEDTSSNSSVKRMNSTKRIKKEITQKRSSFLGLSEPDLIQSDPMNGVSIAMNERERTKVEEILAKQLYHTEIGASSEKLVTNTSEDEKESNGHDEDQNIADEIVVPNRISTMEDEIIKREREIIEMVEKAEKSRDPEPIASNEVRIDLPKPPVAPPRTYPNTVKQKTTDASYYDKKPDYLEDQDSEVLKVEQELQQLEQEELKRKRDNLLFRQACARVFAKNKRYSLENIFDEPTPSVECRKSMPELQCLKLEKEQPSTFRSIHDIDSKYGKSLVNIPGYGFPNYNQTQNDFYKKPVIEFQHDVHRSAFEVPTRKRNQSNESLLTAPKPLPNNKFVHPGEPLIPNRQIFSSDPSLSKPRNRNAFNHAWLKTRPNVEAKSYDQHWLYQEAELRRLQDQKNGSSWQHPKLTAESGPIQRGSILPAHGSSQSSIRKLPSVNNDVQPYLEHQSGPSLPASQPRPIAVEENQNRILSVSGKKKCSFCGNELGRGAAMIIETLCLFYHMECFKCCVCHVQLGNGLNGTDVRVRNQKLHCHNCYSSDDGVKFSCV